MNLLYMIATILFGLILGANAWSYKEAKNWGKQYPQCDGKHQSPITIKSEDKMKFKTINQELKFTDFNKLPKKMTVKNTGRTVEINANWSGEPPRLTGGPLNGNYVFGKSTFHWDPKGKVINGTMIEHNNNDNNFYFNRTNKKGAEHPDYNSEIEANNYVDSEMQMYFYKSDFKSLEKAESQKGGLAVIAIRLRVGYPYPLCLLNEMESRINKVKYINSTTEIPPFRLDTLLMDKRLPFLSYEGSLAYPPCTESVTWLIYDSYVPIADELMDGLKKVKFAEGDVANIRPPQPLNKRQIKNVYRK